MIFNRPVVSGFTTDSRSAAEIQASLHNLNDNQRYERRDVSGPHGYTNNSFPSTYTDVLTVSYHDNYSFLEDQLSDTTYHYKAADGLPSHYNELVDGLTVAGKTRIQGTIRYLWTVSYYDKDLRMIQAVSTNHLNGVDRSLVYSDFAGRITRTEHTHFEGDANREVRITSRSAYDHAGRAIGAYHQINEQPEVQLIALRYNELGSVIEKDLHITEDGPLQSIDYRNNIRGWLNTINNAQRVVSENNDDEDDYFGMELSYDQPDIAPATPQFNGMISAARWSNDLDTVAERAYAYNYDKSYRLLSAEYHEKNGSWQAVNKYTESQTYDINGNIRTLKRRDGRGADQDVLRYDYTGNKLDKVTDTGDTVKGFRDGNTTGADYAYDANGNLVKDRNLGIDTIYYHFSNHADSLVFSNGTRIKYLYDAAGTKLSQRVYLNNDLLNVRDYIGRFEYSDSTLQIIHHAEGRLTKSKVDPTLWVYEYDLADYLGNVRVTFTTEPYTETFTATMEEREAPQEESQFLKVAASRSATSTFIDHTRKSGTPKVTRLNGYHNVKEGPAKGLRVMPGDKVRMEVYVKYLDMRKSDPTFAAATLLSMLATGGATHVPGDPGRGIPNAASGKGGVAGLLGNTEDLEAPKAFLSYYLFDGMFNQVDAGFSQVTKAAAITAGNPKGKHEKLVLEVTIEQAGYLFSHLSHDGNENADIYFDDFTIVHEHGNIVQVQDYYPYGLPFNAKMQEHAVLNRYLYQGKEAQDSTGWYDFHARLYSPELGKFLGADPKGGVMPYNSPYAAMMNNPVFYSDPDGKCPVCVPIIIGAVIGGFAGAVQADVNGGRWYDGLWKGALIGAAGGLAGYFAPAGILPGMAYGAATGAALGAGSAALNGHDAGKGALYGAGMGAVVGGITGGVSAHRAGANIWTGARSEYHAFPASELHLKDPGPKTTGYNDQELNAFRKKQFGSHPGVIRTTVKFHKHVTVNPDGTLNSPELLGPDGKPAAALAYTRPTVWGGGRLSTIHVSPAAFEGNAKLFLTIGHEYVHAYHNYYSLFNLVPDDYYRDYTEYGAYQWTINAIEANKFTGFGGYYDVLESYMRLSGSYGFQRNFTNAPVNIIFKP